MAVYFAGVNTSKWLPYAWLGLIDTTNMLTALALAPVAPVGVWLGVKFVRRVSQALFYRLFDIGPENLVPGSKMPLQRMPDAQDRALLVDYLRRVTAPR